MQPCTRGGQTPLRLTLPKRGFHNPKRLTFAPLNLSRLQVWIDAGRLDASKTLTMKDFVDSRMMDRRIGNGVKVMAKLFRVKDPKTREPLDDEHGNPLYKPFTHKVNLEVSRVSAKAKEMIEAMGGTVIKVHYNVLGIRALLKPHKFPLGLPKPARTPIFLLDKVGAVQVQNACNSSECSWTRSLTALVFNPWTL